MEDQDWGFLRGLAIIVDDVGGNLPTEKEEKVLELIRTWVRREAMKAYYERGFPKEEKAQ